MRIVDIVRNDWLYCRCYFDYAVIINVAFDLDLDIVDTFSIALFFSFIIICSNSLGLSWLVVLLKLVLLEWDGCPASYMDSFTHYFIIIIFKLFNLMLVWRLLPLLEFWLYYCWYFLDFIVVSNRMFPVLIYDIFNSLFHFLIV